MAPHNTIGRSTLPLSLSLSPYQSHSLMGGCVSKDINIEDQVSVVSRSFSLASPNPNPLIHISCATSFPPADAAPPPFQIRAHGRAARVVARAGAKG